MGDSIQLLLGGGHRLRDVEMMSLPQIALFTRSLMKLRDMDSASEAIMMQMAIGSLLDKKAGKAFQERVKELLNGSK